MLDRFYAEVKLAKASNRGEIVKNLERLQNVSRVSDESVKIAADLYLQYAQKETLSAAEGAEAVRELKAILKEGRNWRITFGAPARSFSGKSMI